MTDQTTTPAAGPAEITMATTAYEISSLLNSYAELPAPRYITISEAGHVGFQFETRAMVETWAAEFGATATTRRLNVYRPDDKPGTETRFILASPFDARVAIRLYAHTHDDD